MVLHGIRRSMGVRRLQPSMGIKRKEKRNVPANTSFPGGGGRYSEMKEDMRLALAASWDCRMLFRSGNHIIKYLQATHWRGFPPPQQILFFSSVLCTSCRETNCVNRNSISQENTCKHQLNLNGVPSFTVTSQARIEGAPPPINDTCFTGRTCRYGIYKMWV